MMRTPRMSALALGNESLGGRVAHSLELVPVRVTDLGGIVILAVMPAWSWLAFGAAAQTQRSFMELPYALLCICDKSHMCTISSSCRAAIFRCVDVNYWHAAFLICRWLARRFRKSTKAEHAKNLIVKAAGPFWVICSECDVAND